MGDYRVWLCVLHSPFQYEGAFSPQRLQNFEVPAPNKKQVNLIALSSSMVCLQLKFLVAIHKEGKHNSHK